MPFPLTTARLLIDPLAEPDVADFVAYRQVPEVARWQSWNPAYSVADARRLIAGQPLSGLPEAGSWVQLGVRDHHRRILYGDVGVHRLETQPATFEIGMTLAPAAQGQGLGSEAVARVLDFLFDEADAHRVVAFCDTRNTASARLLRRTGMRQESSQVEADFFKGEWTTLAGFAVLARERGEH